MRQLKSIIAVLLLFFPIFSMGQQVDYNQPKEYIVGGIKVTGVNYLSEEQIISVTGIAAGDKIMIPSQELSNALKRVTAQRYFSNAELKIDSLSAQKDTVWLALNLTQLPRVSKWVISGVKSGQRSDLQERLKLINRGTALSDYVTSASVDIIKKYFKEKGYNNCKVNILKEDDAVIQNAVRVTFDVDKGEKVKIGKITISGNEQMKEWPLLKSMKKTRDKRLRNFFRTKKFNETEFKNDKANLIQTFNEHGYRDAKIVSDTIYYITPNRLQIDLKVEEGNQYHFRDITWTGNSLYSAEQLNSVLRIKKGDVYDVVTLDHRLNGDPKQMDQDVKKLYTDFGYLFFNVLPVEKKIENDSVDIEMRLYEGKPATFNKIIINGNNITSEKIARRSLFTKPGYLFSQSDFERSVRELSSIGHFNPEVFQNGTGYSVIPNQNNNTVDISYNLEEKPNSQIELSGGWGANTFVGSLGVSFNNFAIKRIFKKGAWRPVPLGDGQSLSIKFQTNGTYYTSLTASFIEPWLLGTKPVSLNVSSYFSRQTNSNYYFQSNNEYFQVLGVAAGLGSRLEWPDNYFVLYHTFSWQTYMLKNWNYNFLFKTGHSHNFSYTATLSRNSTDQMIYPRSGSDFTFAIQLTPPYSAFRKNADYTSMSDEKKYKWIEYHKWTFKGDVYQRIVGDLVLRTAAEFGYLGYYSKKLGYSPFECYQVGGDGMSGYDTYGSDIIALRGYPNYSLTPYENGVYLGHVYDKFTLEVRYPIMLQTATSMYALLFLEGGNAWKNLSDFKPFEIKRSAGVGLRVLLPMVGTLGVDWGYGFDPVPTEGKKRGGSQFHFVIGQQF